MPKVHVVYQARHMADFSASGLGPLVLVNRQHPLQSGFSLALAAPDPGYVAKPGCSEHETGLAIDLAEAAETIDFIRPHFPYDGVCGSFRKAAARYGFVERYRADKSALTGIAAEPWHFRYVGIPHALLMEQRGLCLEEYVERLKEHPMTCILENGRRARVSRHAADAGLPPAQGPRQVSADNLGGVIVTDWEVPQ